MRCQSQGQSYGSNGGGRLKQTFGQRQALDSADDECTRQGKDEIQREDGRGVIDGFFFHPPPKHLGAFLPAEYSKRIGDKYCRCCGLDAARRRAR